MPRVLFVCLTESAWVAVPIIALMASTFSGTTMDSCWTPKNR